MSGNRYAYMAAAQASLIQRDPANAEAKLNSARPELQLAVERHPAWVPPQAYWIVWQLSMASAQAQGGRCRDAMAGAASAVELARSLTHLDPRSKFTQEILAGALYSSGVTLEECGRFAVARAQLTSAVESWDALVRHDPENAEWRYQLDRSRATSKPD